MSIGYQGPGIYHHYKGGLYNVMGLATNTETGEVFVCYAQFKDKSPDRYFVRPLDMFNELLDVPGDEHAQIPRFRKVGF